MSYDGAEHLLEWDDLRTDGPRDDETFSCGECGEPIEAEGAACLNCAEQGCAHANTHDVISEQSVCRFIPSTWERESDDDPYETATVRDRAIICDDCGECVDFHPGD